MSARFIEISVNTFEQLVEGYVQGLRNNQYQRTIDSIHMHHTWKPTHSQYRGYATIEGMWRYHTQTNGWSDIAQHITIAPDGKIWTGRSWNRAPASARGYNGTSRSGPFMFEMIGDFDTGRDPFQNPQRKTVIDVISILMEKFDLPSSSLRFHNHMTNQKTCPGTSINYADILVSVDAKRQTLSNSAGKAVKVQAVAAEVLSGMRPVAGESDGTRDVSDHDHEHVDYEQAELCERMKSAQKSDSFEEFRPHLINLRQGTFSTGGDYQTSPKDLDEIFNVHIPNAIRQAQDDGLARLPLLIWAHGGLNKEKAALRGAATQIPFWQKNHVYPIFFIWETGLGETLFDMINAKLGTLWPGSWFGGKRGGEEPRFVSHLSDPIVEKTARLVGGEAIWGAMKESARKAHEPSIGGAHLFAQRLAAFIQNNPNSIELHAVGHSAGSNFHSWFLPKLTGFNGKPVVKTVQFLAPAVRIDEFKARVQPLVKNGVDALTVYTMTDKLERDDNCGQVYRKSLLYLIHKSLEPKEGEPILGLQKSIQADADLRRLFRLNGGAATGAEVIWSQQQGAPRHSSMSTTHGGFDNDPFTLNSVCRRIRDLDDIVEYPPFVGERGIDSSEETSSLEAEIIGLIHQASERPVPKPISMRPGPAIQIAQPQGGNRKALCIGIDSYPVHSDRLGGCVADAETWQEIFRRQGFSTELLLNDNASFRNIMDALRQLVEGARTGDVIAVQYAGHGTHMPDEDGDEKDDNRDEAICCHDFRDGRLLIDDDLAVLFNRLPAGVNFSVFFDCCHSGSATRMMADLTQPVLSGPAEGTPRYIQPDAQLEAAFREARRHAGGKKGRSVRTSTGRNPYTSALEVLFAGCLPGEQSYERDGHGVFTSAAKRVVDRYGLEGVSNRVFIEYIKAEMRQERRQHPELYCGEHIEDRAFLGPVS